MSLHNLPALNATLNGVTTVLLMFGFYFIKRGNKIAHRNCMIAAVCVSTVFLASYLTYHFTVKIITIFHEPAWFRPIYLTILTSHTILAVLVLPLIITSVILAAKGKFDGHRKIVRWTWPIWMYVSVTGVFVYLLLYQIFPQY